MNKKISFIIVILCLVSVVIMIRMKGISMIESNINVPEENIVPKEETAPIVTRIAGQEIEYTPKDRKLTIEDFENVELEISESDLKKQLGEPDGYLTKELGEINIAGVGTMFYVLEDGRMVIPFFGYWNPVLFSLVVYEGDSVVGTIKELYEIDENEFCVEGVIRGCKPEEIKLTVEDFEEVELWDTKPDVKAKVGVPNTWTGSGLPGNGVYVLKDGRTVIPYFMNGYLYKLIVWKGDSKDCILKEVDEGDIREVRCNGSDIKYVTRHRNLTVEDFKSIELGLTRSDILEQLGGYDIVVWDVEAGRSQPAYVLKDEKVAVCYMSETDGIDYLEKIVIYNGDDIDYAIE